MARYAHGDARVRWCALWRRVRFVASIREGCRDVRGLCLVGLIRNDRFADGDVFDLHARYFGERLLHCRDTVAAAHAIDLKADFLHGTGSGSVNARSAPLRTNGRPCALKVYTPHPYVNGAAEF